MERGDPLGEYQSSVFKKTGTFRSAWCSSNFEGIITYFELLWKKRRHNSSALECMVECTGVHATRKAILFFAKTKISAAADEHVFWTMYASPANIMPIAFQQCMAHPMPYMFGALIKKGCWHLIKGAKLLELVSQLIFCKANRYIVNKQDMPEDAE